MIEKTGYKMQITHEMLASLYSSAEPDGKVWVETPKSAEWLAEREEFSAQYDTLAEYGRKAGFLEQEPCYECGGELVITKHTHDIRWEDAK